ncbi:hypothetical protein EUGRSUZ_C01324 [Eucalyptus grandis]|uniref:Uncharacterized protein n=2 Tax=Eucalyptus grandis TaxID=71139 RepID=A0ACC3LEJ2_EUCGR|nr:hypothetical protein EUGRSUZ_C01324 [Eucalyptus grandis]
MHKVYSLYHFSPHKAQIWPPCKISNQIKASRTRDMINIFSPTSGHNVKQHYSASLLVRDQGTLKGREIIRSTKNIIKLSK